MSLHHKPVLDADTIERLSGTAAVDPDGRPLVLHHATFSRFDRFQETRDLGFHFGSWAQAVRHTRNQRDLGITRQSQEARFISAALAARNPLVMHHDPCVWNVEPLAYRWRHIIGCEASDRLRRIGREATEMADRRMENPGAASMDGNALDRIRLNLYSEMQRKPREELLRRLLDAGYDSIVYANKFEARYRGTPVWDDYSWVALDPNVIVPLNGEYVGVDVADIPPGVIWCPQDNPVAGGPPPGVLPDHAWVPEGYMDTLRHILTPELEALGFDPDRREADSSIGILRATIKDRAYSRNVVDIDLIDGDEASARRVFPLELVEKPLKGGVSWQFQWLGGESPEFVVERIREFAAAADVQPRREAVLGM